MPQHTLYRLHLEGEQSVIIKSALPQHTLYRLHRKVGKPRDAGRGLCLSTLYTGCITPPSRVLQRKILCLSTLYTGCILSASSPVSSRPSLCLSTLYTGCIDCPGAAALGDRALPQHTLYRLHHFVKLHPVGFVPFASAHSIQVASLSLLCLLKTVNPFASAHSIQVASQGYAAK